MRQTFLLPPHLSRDRALDRIHSVLAHLPQDQGWEIDVHEKKAKRSDAQNRYLWGAVYPSILAAGGNLLCGWTAQDLHEYLLGEHFGWEVVEGFGKKRQRPIRRSSALSKLEFMEFVAFIQQRMAEHSIYVPDPNEVRA